MIKKDPIGTYRFDDGQIEPNKYFIYEVCIYKYWKNGCSLVESKFYKSDHFIKPITKKKGAYEKSIILIAAPFSFIKENKLETFELKKKNGKARRSH